MTILLKPVTPLKSCLLNLESIKGILELVSKNFTSVLCSAADKTLQISDEKPNIFLDAIANSKTLDYFRVVGKNEDDAKEVNIVFDQYVATVTLRSEPSEKSWFEHFMFDLNKFLLSPNLLQAIGLLLSFQNYRIILYENTPNPFLENIKANLVSNIIWFIFGILVSRFWDRLLALLSINTP